MRKFSDMPRRGFKKVEIIPVKVWQYRVLLNNEEHRLVITLKEDWYTVEITFTKPLWATVRPLRRTVLRTQKL